MATTMGTTSGLGTTSATTGLGAGTAATGTGVGTYGKVVVTLKSAHDLRDKTWIGKADPYCVVKVADAEIQTHHVKNAGDHAVWDESFAFNNVAPDDVIEFNVYDHNRLMKDSLMGTGSLSMRQVFMEGRLETRVPLTSRTGTKDAGEIWVSLRSEEGAGARGVGAGVTGMETTGVRGVTTGMAATSLEGRGTGTTTITGTRGVEALEAETRGPVVEGAGYTATTAGAAPAGYTTTTAGTTRVAGTTGISGPAAQAGPEAVCSQEYFTKVRHCQ